MVARLKIELLNQEKVDILVLFHRLNADRNVLLMDQLSKDSEGLNTFGSHIILGTLAVAKRV